MTTCGAAAFANKRAYSLQLDANVIAAKSAVFDIFHSCANVRKTKNFCSVRILFCIVHSFTELILFVVVIISLGHNFYIAGIEG